MISGRIKDAIRERSKEREKAKIEKERKKRRSRKYGQKELTHAKRGVLSCMLGGLTLFLLILVFSVSYISRGEVSLLIGRVGLAAAVFSALGLAYGIQGFKEREKKYISCRIGVVWNGFFLLGLFMIFLRGLF